MSYFNKKLLLGGGILSLLCYLYFSQSTLLSTDAEYSVADNKSHANKPVKVKKSLTTEHVSTEPNKDGNEQHLVSQQTAQQEKAVSKHKQYSDDWCIANKELNESDLSYANAQVNDWNLLQGKARAKSPYSSYADEFSYPNNAMIASYEALPLEELRELAVNGDKWAMVAYVQNPFENESAKNKVAKELLVIGASYYALEQLVLSSVASAKTSYRKAGEANQETLDHIVEALKYVYWGAQNYNLGGLEPFIATAWQRTAKIGFIYGAFIAFAGR